MPSIKISGADELVMVLNRLSEESEGAIKKAVFDGAAVIADAVRSNINGLRVDGPSAWETRRRTEQKAGLQAGLTTYQIEDKGGKIEGGVGFSGTNSRGQSNRMVARVFNSGTSFSSKQPFFDRAVRSSRGAAQAAVRATLEEEIQKIVKG